MRRRSVSVSLSTYDALKRAAEAAGVSCSEWVTELVRAARPDLLPPQTHVRPASSKEPAHVRRPARLDLVTGDSFDRGEVAFVDHEQSVRVAAPSRAELDAMAAQRKLTARTSDVAPGTLCANCVEAPATHMGHVDHESGLYALCDECELPAREGHGIERGYEPNGGLPTNVQAKRGVRAAMGDECYERAADIDRRFGRKPAQRRDPVDIELQQFAYETGRRIRTKANVSNHRSRRERKLV